MKVNLSLIILVITTGFIIAGSTAQIGEKAPDFNLTDSNGKQHSLSDYKGKYVVLEWVNFGCPFVQKHYNSKNMQTLQKEYRDKGVVWLSISSSASGKQGYLSAAEINETLKEKSSQPNAYLIDEDGTVGKLYDAKATPHMYIIDPDGNLIYNGAIDNIRSTNVEDVAKAHNYVSKTLDALLTGEKVEPFSTEAYGCSVKYK
ncbi:MAG: thioredoxin family protein [Calditrichaceae bacterium]|nr:thioredoxin family protein [Calditrichaceae bacterium]RQV96709.1 MAG: thioredoxin family protein [Calditrichota bacterium]